MNNTIINSWGNNLADWISIQEKQSIKGYDYVLNLIGTASKNILDLGCGSGKFCQLAQDKNMQITGMDISVPFITEANRRVKGATFIVANMDQIPLDTSTFDFVCGFNSFQYVQNLNSSIKEVYRVLKKDGKVIALIWDQKKNCEIATFLTDVISQFPLNKTAHRDPFCLSEDNTLEIALKNNGFTSIKVQTIPLFWEYENLEIAMKGLLSLGALADTIEKNGVQDTTKVILKFIGSYQQENGRIIFKNHYKIISGIK